MSKVRILYNGAEPISEILANQFMEEMATHKLQSSAMCPVYGLAEATLAVSISRLESKIISQTLNRKKLSVGKEVVYLSHDPDTISFVNVGKPIKNCQIKLTDRIGKEVDSNIIGKLWIKGENVTSGYYRNPKLTSEVFSDDQWLDTGDLGFIKEEALYITGRAKDIIFSNGQNYYPHDLEQIAESVDGVELNKVVFGGAFNSESQCDEVIGFLFFRGKIEDFIPLAKEVAKAISDKVGLGVDYLIPIKNIPRTTSGKLQRFKLIQDYLEGFFKPQITELLALETEAFENFSLPNGSVEQKLYDIWKSIFPGRSFGVVHNFFEIGGTSLKAAELAMGCLEGISARIGFGHSLQI